MKCEDVNVKFEREQEVESKTDEISVSDRDYRRIAMNGWVMMSSKDASTMWRGLNDDDDDECVNGFSYPFGLGEWETASNENENEVNKRKGWFFYEANFASNEHARSKERIDIHKKSRQSSVGNPPNSPRPYPDATELQLL